MSDIERLQKGTFAQNCISKQKTQRWADEQLVERNSQG